MDAIDVLMQQREPSPDRDLPDPEPGTPPAEPVVPPSEPLTPPHEPIVPEPEPLSTLHRMPEGKEEIRPCLR